MQTVGRFDMWVTPKTNRPSFCLILKLSHALDGLFSVLSRLHGCKHKCAFCWMKDHWTTTFRYCCLGDFLAWNPQFIFRYRCSMLWRRPFYMFWKIHISLTLDLLYWIVLRALFHLIYLVIFYNFLVFNFPFFNFEQYFPFPWISIPSSFSVLYSTIN